MSTQMMQQILDAARPEGMALRLCSGEFAIHLSGV